MATMLWRGQWRPLFLLVSIVLALLVGQRVAAHGEGESIVQVTDAPLGSYRLTIRTAPRTLLVGPLHVLVQVSDSQGRPQVLQSLTVAVQALSSIDDMQITRTLPMLPPGNHEAQLTLPQPGEYQLTLRLDGSADAITFTVVALSGVWMQGVLLVFGGVTSVAALWLVKESFTVWRRKP